MISLKPILVAAFGYQGNNMALPVASVDVAIPFYVNVLGFQVVSKSDLPPRSAVIGRDGVQMGLVENGGDSSQDGCAFHVTDVEGLFAEFQANGLQKDGQVFDLETHGDQTFKVFYVIAPDGLCFWFGQRT